MKQNVYALTSYIFGVLAVLHAARLYYGGQQLRPAFDTSLDLLVCTRYRRLSFNARWMFVHA